MRNEGGGRGNRHTALYGVPCGKQSGGEAVSDGQLYSERETREASEGVDVGRELVWSARERGTPA